MYPQGISQQTHSTKHLTSSGLGSNSYCRKRVLGLGLKSGLDICYKEQLDPKSSPHSPQPDNPLTPNSTEETEPEGWKTQKMTEVGQGRAWKGQKQKDFKVNTNIQTIRSSAFSSYPAARNQESFLEKMNSSKEKTYSEIQGTPRKKGQLSPKSRQLINPAHTQRNMKLAFQYLSKNS